MAQNNSPADLQKLLFAEDKRQGFPLGTMASLMKQETGGNNKYLADPSAYHYGLNKDGKRIAGHTGKISTAFGPFGLLESTVAKPGYGVKPLKSKDLASQIEFAGNYLQGRAKSAGSLSAGLAGYGEGQKYANQVLARIPQTRVEIPQQQAQMASNKIVTPIASPIPLQNNQPQRLVQEQIPMTVAQNTPIMANATVVPAEIQAAPLVAPAMNKWSQFLQAVNQKTEVTPQQLAYDAPTDNFARIQEIESQNPTAQVANNTGFMQSRQRNPQAMALLNQILNTQQETYSV